MILQAFVTQLYNDITGNFVNIRSRASLLGKYYYTAGKRQIPELPEYGRKTAAGLSAGAIEAEIL